VDEYARAGEREYRNGFHERSFVTIFGSLILRIARTRTQSFLPLRPNRSTLRAPQDFAPGKANGEEYEKNMGKNRKMDISEDP